jgi:hypothetical protein
LITIYFKIKGQKYLQFVLKDLIQNLVDEDLKYEIDSTKIKDEDPSILQENVKGISKITNSILNILSQSVESFPVFDLIVFLNL